MVFLDNQASASETMPTMSYTTHIGKKIMDHPYTQGYNNYDSSYTNCEPFVLKAD
ncbi:MAG: hypothetical protein FWC74_09150 [Candidatus Bathyarchaeota archaeon]|nr:hypothetical protein [Candidatus Termitimicrobium sp.]